MTNACVLNSLSVAESQIVTHLPSGRLLWFRSDSGDEDGRAKPECTPVEFLKRPETRHQSQHPVVIVRLSFDAVLATGSGIIFSLLR